MTRDPHTWAHDCTCTHTTTCNPCTETRNWINNWINRENA